MSVLPYQDILTRCGLQPSDPDATETRTGPITPCLKRNIRSAGYDLRLGDQYYMKTDIRGGKLEIGQLNPKTARTLIVPANQVVIVTTIESLKLPDNVVGHLTLKLELLLRGLIMANQSQVDAGYEGGLFILLYNLSNHNVSLHYGESILRFELAELTSPTAMPYRGAYKNLSLAQALKSPVESSLAAMRKEVDRSSKKLLWTQVVGLAIIIITTVLSYWGPLATRMTRVEQQVVDVERLHDQESALYGSARKDQLDSLTKDVTELQQEVKNLKKGHATAR